MTDSQLRYLLGKEFIARALEITKPGSVGRVFRLARGPHFDRMTNFILTPAGQAWCRQGEVQAAATRGAAEGVSRPVWQGRLRELHWGAAVAKRFKQPAPSQELILPAFEEDGWPAILDDPLPPAEGQDSKRRLHQTVGNLNRGLKHVRFEVCGNGTAIRWCCRPA